MRKNKIISSFFLFQLLLCSFSLLSQDQQIDDLNLISNQFNLENIEGNQYTFNNSVYEKIIMSSPRLAILKGIVTDVSTGKNIEVDIELMDNSENEVIGEYKSNNVTGKYLISLPSGTNYGITISKEGYLFQSKNVYFPENSEYIELVQNFQLNKLEIGSKTVLNNVFFDYENDTLKQQSIPELEKIARLLKENKHLIIEIVTFTDHKESKELNQELATNRSKAIVDFLIEKGIDSKRLIFKGFSFDSPIKSDKIDAFQNINNTTHLKIVEL